MLNKKLAALKITPSHVINLKKGKLCATIALVYKEMKLKPSAFKENKILDDDF